MAIALDTLVCLIAWFISMTYLPVSGTPSSNNSGMVLVFNTVFMNRTCGSISSFFILFFFFFRFTMANFLALKSIIYRHHPEKKKLKICLKTH